MVVVLKQLQKIILIIKDTLSSLSRFSWDTGVPLVGEGCFFPFITNFLIEVANQATHLLICRDDFYYFL